MSEHGIDIVLKARDEASEKVGNVSRNFSLLTRGLSAATALRMGSFVAVDLYRAWQVEQAKVSGNYVNILEAEIKLNESLYSTARAIPVIGRGIAFAMEAFGENEGLKNSLKLVEQMRAETAAAAKEAKNWSFNAMIQGAQAAGRPQSEIAAMQAEQAQSGRQETIDALKQKIAEARKALADQIKSEDLAATVKNIAMSASLVGVAIRGIRGQALPNRSGSEGMREKIPGMESELANLEKSGVEAATADEQRLGKMRADERTKIDKADTENAYKISELKISLMTNEVERAKATVEAKYQKEIAEARKAGLHLIEIDERRKLELTKIDQDVASKKADWEKKQLDTIAEMELGYIKDKTEREKAAINLKYDLEIRKAKEAGMSTDSMERQRTIALELAGMGGDRPLRRGVNATEVSWDPRSRLFSQGSSGGSSVDYSQKTASSVEKLPEQNNRLIQLMQRLVDYVTRNPNSGSSLIPSNFQ